MDSRSLMESLTAFGVNKNIIGDVINGDLSTFNKFLEREDSFPTDHWWDLYDLASCALGEEQSDFANFLLQNFVKTRELLPVHTHFLLERAIIKNDSKMCHLLLSEAITSVDARDKFGRTFLHRATVEDMPLLLCYAGSASVNIKDYDGYSALHFLIINDYEAAEILLKHKAKITGINENDRNAMWAAVKNLCFNAVDEIIELRYFYTHSMKDTLKPVVCGNESICEIIVNSFLRHNLAFYPEDVNDMEFLLAAVKKGYVKIVEELLNFIGFNEVHEIWRMIEKLFVTAAQSGQLEIATLLKIVQADIKATFSTEDSLIYVAVLNRNSKMIEMLLANGTKAYTDYRLLSVAFDTRSIGTIELLLQHGVNINCQNTSGMTILHWCLDPEAYIRDKITYDQLSKKSAQDVKHGEHSAMSTISEIFRMLVKRGADVNSKDYEGFTPLHLAAKKNHWALVELLLDSGADINFRDMRGRTALFFAAENGAKNVVDVLLKHGATVDSKDVTDATPLHACSTIEICRLLLENGANVNNKDNMGSTPLIEAVTRGNCAVVETLLDWDADINHRDSYGFTALHTAFVYHEIKVVDVLLKYNPDVTLRNECGITALHYCTVQRAVEICQLLLEKGGDPNCKGDEGFTALHCAAKLRNSDRVKYLLNLGTDIDCTNNCGNTALHIAFKEGNRQTVKILLAHGADINIRNEKYYTAFQMRYEGMEDLDIIFSLHVIKMKTANLFVCSLTICWLYEFLEQSAKSKATKYESKCAKELERMKIQKIGNSNFSLYQILKGTSIEFVRNEDIVQYIKEYNFLKNFPVYGDMIRYKCCRCLKRVELTDKGMKVCQNLFRAVSMDKCLPYIYIQRVFGYLSNRELEILIQALENVN